MCEEQSKGKYTTKRVRNIIFINEFNHQSPIHQFPITNSPITNLYGFKKFNKNF